MRKLQAITGFLLAHFALREEQVFSVADRGETIPTGTDLGHGIELCRFKYEALIQIERLPASAGATLLAQLVGWLCDNDKERTAQDVADPEVDVTLNDAHTCDVDIQIEFEEAIQLVPDEAGEILFNGTRWRLADAPVDIAEALDDFSGAAASV